MFVRAAGMVTAVGFNTPASCAAIRAGIRAVSKANLWDGESGEYISAGKVDLPQWWEGMGKLTELVAPAICECLSAARETPPKDIPILLGVADEGRPHRFAGLEEQLLGEVEEKLNVEHNPYSQLVPSERVSCVIALSEARRIIGDGRASTCIVAGVDSFLQQKVVDSYLERRRVLTPRYSNGFSPGEAGCAVLVSRLATGKNGELEILGIGSGQEEATIDSDKPTRCEGLTDAIRNALSDAGIAMRDTSYRITDLNGEQYKFKEAALAEGRLYQDRGRGFSELWHPIEYLGDIGAAIGPCVLAVALDAGQKGYAPGARALCHFSGDDGKRGAVITQFIARREG